MTNNLCLQCGRRVGEINSIPGASNYGFHMYMSPQGVHLCGVEYWG